jgi:hypothetical protein
MSDYKMSDWFGLPFTVEPSGIISDQWDMGVGEFCGTMEQSKAAAHAINSHDALVARVAQLENGYSQILSEISTTSHAENYKLLDIISRALEDK